MFSDKQRKIAEEALLWQTVTQWPVAVQFPICRLHVSIGATSTEWAFRVNLTPDIPISGWRVILPQTSPPVFK